MSTSPPLPVIADHDILVAIEFYADSTNLNPYRLDHFDSPEDGITCLYDDGDGNRCFVGQVIADLGGDTSRITDQTANAQSAAAWAGLTISDKADELLSVLQGAADGRDRPASLFDPPLPEHRRTWGDALTYIKTTHAWSQFERNAR